MFQNCVILCILNSLKFSASGESEKVYFSKLFFTISSTQLQKSEATSFYSIDVNPNETCNEFLHSFSNSFKEEISVHLYPSNSSQSLFVVNCLLEFYKSSTNFVWKPKFFIMWPRQDSLPSIIELDKLSFTELLQKYLNVNSIGFPINSQVYISLWRNHSKILIWESYKFKNLSKCTLIGEYKLLISDINLRELNGDTFYERINRFEVQELLRTIEEGVIETIEQIDPLSERRHNLSGVEIVAVAQNDPDYQPRISFKTFPNGTVEFEAGMCLRVLQALQILMGFSYSALEGKGWMGIFPNGTFTGMSGQIVNEEADISISQASTIMMTDQLQGISFLHPTSYGQLLAIFRQPNLGFVKDIVSTAFTPFVWLSILAIWLLILAALRITNNIIQKQNNIKKEIESLIFIRPWITREMILKRTTTDNSDKDFVNNSFWWTISTTCCLGWHMTPSSFSIRFIFTLGILQALVTFVAFSASLVIHLFTEQVPIQNFMDLEVSSINIYADKWLPMAQTVAHELYRKRGFPENHKLEDHYIDLGTAVPRILTKPWGFITFTDAVAIVFERLNFSNVFYCQTVYGVTVSTNVYPNAMYVKKGSPLKEIINPQIIELLERGILFRLNTRYKEETTIRCPNRSRQYRGGFYMEDVVTPFIAISLGFFTSIGIYLIERYSQRMCRLFKVNIIMM